MQSQNKTINSTRRPLSRVGRAPATGDAVVVECRAARTSSACRCPLIGWRVEAGFPSPAEDYLEGTLDLNEFLVENPAATFFVRVTGESMRDAGILPGDLLVVDRSRTAQSGDVVIAVVDGQMAVKRLWCKGRRVELRPANREFPTIRLAGTMELEVWGVVRHVIHSV